MIEEPEWTVGESKYGTARSSSRPLTSLIASRSSQVLTPGNSKLRSKGRPGSKKKRRRIWSFSLPSRKTCPGRSDLCSKACYSAHLEAFRPNIKSQYEKNFRLSRRKTFVKRMIHFIESKKIEVVRIHAAGDFYSSLYTRKWLEVMKTCPQTIFYFYTRSWRVREILKVLKEIAGLKNVRAWFSCDQETGT